MSAHSTELNQHPELGRIVLALLDGRPSSEIAAEFAVSVAALEGYAQQAGLVPSGHPQPVHGDPHQVQQQAEARPAVPPEPASVEEPPVPEPDLLEARRATQLAERRARDLAREAYEQQPVYASGGTMHDDPLQGGPFTLHVGFQPPERLMALVMRERAERARRVAEWYAVDPIFRWGQKPPENL